MRSVRFKKLLRNVRKLPDGIGNHKVANLNATADENPLVTKWRSGGVALGCSCKLSSPLSAEAMAKRGLDFLYVDQQHGVFDNSGLLAVLQVVGAAGIVSLTRVPANIASSIGLALDLGAMGVIVPAVETREEAQRAVEACHYPPKGKRSHGHVRQAGVTPLCIVLVETDLGLTNVKAIAEVEGVDAVMVGLQDLALSLGISLQGEWLQDAALSIAVGEIQSACKEAGIVSGIGAANGREAARWINHGFQMVSLGNDLTYLKSAVDENLAMALSAIEANPR